MPSKKKRCRNFPNLSSQPTNRDFETDTLTVPASQPSQAPPCTSSSACVTVASDTGLTDASVTMPQRESCPKPKSQSVSPADVQLLTTLDMGQDPRPGAQIPSCGTESGEDANEAARDMLEQVKAQQPQTGLADMRLPHAGLEISNSQQAAWDMLEHTEAQVGIADLPPHGNCNQALPLGDHDAAASCQIIIAAYEEAVHFAPNLHQVPQGGVGSKFVNLLAGLYQRFGVGATGDGLALEAAMVMTQLLLQQPVGCQNVREHRQHLERRLGLWEQGDVNNLMIEARTVQAQLKQRNHSSKSRHKAQDDARRLRVALTGCTNVAAMLVAMATE